MIFRVSGNLVDGVTGGPVPGLTMIAIDSRSGYSIIGAANATGSFSFVLPPSPAITVAAYGQGVYEGNIVYLGTRPYVTTWVNITIAHLNAQVLANVTS